MRYVVARYQENDREAAYRIYISDAAYCYMQSVGADPSMRYVEMLENKTPDHRTGDEIAVDVIERMGLVIDGSF